MSSTQAASNNNGVGIFSLTALVFVVLKLTGYIAWSWWWVFAPIWGVFALIYTIALIVTLATGIASMLDNRK